MSTEQTTFLLLSEAGRLDSPDLSSGGVCSQAEGFPCPQSFGNPAPCSSVQQMQNSISGYHTLLPAFDLGSGNSNFHETLTALGLDPAETIAAIVSVASPWTPDHGRAFLMADTKKGFLLTRDRKLTERRHQDSLPGSDPLLSSHWPLSPHLPLTPNALVSSPSIYCSNGSVFMAIGSQSGFCLSYQSGWRIRTTDLGRPTWEAWTPELGLQVHGLQSVHQHVSTAGLTEFCTMVAHPHAALARSQARAGVRPFYLGILGNALTVPTLVSLTALWEPDNNGSEVETALSAGPPLSEADANAAVWACLKGIQESDVHI